MNTLMTTVLAALAVLLAVQVAAVAAEGVEGDNRRLYVRPIDAAKPLTIDGKLDDWDTSASIFTTMNPQVADRFHAWVATMYDQEALYLGVRVRDDTPMNNLHGPEGDAQWAWNADSFQFRLFTDTGTAPSVFPDPDAEYPVAHLLMWYFAPEERPCLQLSFGRHFAKYGGGSGVVPEGEYEAAYARLPDGSGYTFEYRLPWDLLGFAQAPEAGDLVPGTYQIQFDDGSGLRSPRRFAATDLLCTYATNQWRQYESWGRVIFAGPEGPAPAYARIQPLPAAPTPLALDYVLPRAGRASLVVKDGEGQTVRRLLTDASVTAGRSTARWDGRDQAGRLLPPGPYSWKAIVHDPITTQYLMGVNNGGTPTYHTADGTGSWGGDHGPPSAVCRTAHGMALGWEAQESAPGIILCSAAGEKRWGAYFNSARHMATDGKRLFCGGTRRTKTVVVMDAKTGRRIAFDNGAATVEPLPGPSRPPAITGLAYRKGVLYAAYASANRVVHYDGRLGTIQKTVPVDRPGHLLPLAGGRLLVVSGGQVLALSQDGDRSPFGDAEHLPNPQGMAVGPAGAIYISNGEPHHSVAAFRPDGTFVKTIGTAGGRPRVGRYDPAGMRNPYALAFDGQGRLWVAECSKRPKRISVWDVATGQNVAEYFGAPRFANFAEFDPEDPTEIFSADCTLWKVDLETGERRMHSTLWEKQGDDTPPPYDNFRLIRTGNGHQYMLSYRTPSAIYLRDGDRAKPFLQVLKDNRIWADRNRDQRYQDDEIVQLPVQVRRIECLDAALNLWISGFVFRPLRIEPDGVPVYDFQQPEETGIRVGGPILRMMPDPRDDSFYVVAPGKFDNGVLQPGSLRRMTPGGEVLWEYPGVVAWRDAWNLGLPENGEIYGPWGMPSMKGDILALGTFRGSCHLLTRNGMYITEVLPDMRRMRFGPGVLRQEMHGGALVKWKDGTYLLACGDNDARLLTVSGLDTLQTATGRFPLTAADMATAQAAFEAYQKERARRQPLVIARGALSLRDVPKRGVPPAQPIERTVSNTFGFTFRAAWDPQSLHCRFDITTPHALQNARPRAAAEQGGNLMVLHVKPEGAAPLRLRILYPPAGAAVVLDEAGQPVEATVSPLQYDAARATQQVRVTLPWKRLGLRPASFQTLQCNVGVLLGNEAGTALQESAYWQEASAAEAASADHAVPCGTALLE